MPHHRGVPATLELSTWDGHAEREREPWDSAYGFTQHTNEIVALTWRIVYKKKVKKMQKTYAMTLTWKWCVLT